MSTILQNIYNDIFFKKQEKEPETIEMSSLDFNSLPNKMKRMKIKEYLDNNKECLEKEGIKIDDNVFVNYKFIKIRFKNYKVEHLVVKPK